MFNNTDNELRRYEEAELYSATATPDMFFDIKSQFNTVTGQTDLLAPLPSGGFVRLASQAPDIMVEAPAMPGMGADAPLPVEGPIARAVEQTALETEPATAEMRPSLAGRTEVVKEATKALISGAIVEPANFLKDNFGLYDPLAVQFVDPETGEFDFKLHIMSREEKADLDAKMAAGELPYAMSLDDLVAPDKDASAVAGVAGGISQFLGAYLGIGKLFRVGSGFTGAMTQGAAADFLAFDGSDKAVTDMLLDMGWIEPNMITELLKKDPNDPDYQGRFKAAIEGAGLGGVIEKALIPALGLAFRAIKDKDVPVDAARQAIQQGKLMMQGALLKAGQNAELRMAERGPAVDFLSSTMMSGVDPTIVTDPLVAAAGRAVGGDLSKQVDDARVAYEASPNDAALRKNYLELRRQRDADPVAKVEPPTDDTPGIIAFHGSAADFSEFKLEKIGTGEGAQAYGYGLYFADKEEIAKFYRDALREEKNIIQYNGKPLNSVYTQDVEDVFLDDIEATFQEAERIGIPVDRDDVVTVFSQLGQGIGSLSDARAAVDSLSPSFGSGTNRYLNFYDMVLSKKLEIPDIKGRVYKVALTPKPEDLLDYDKPLSEQPKILSAIDKVHGDSEIIITQLNLDPATATGGQLIDALAGIVQTTESKKAAAEWMEKAGIPGIKFFDNTSRNTADGKLIDVSEADDGFRAKVAVDNRAGGLGGSGRIVTTSPPYKTKQEALDWADKSIGKKSSNYVIFDDSMIKILEKYGIVGPVAISAMALSEDES